MREVVEVPEASELEVWDRRRPTVPRQEYVPYRPAPDLVPEMAAFGDGYRWHIDSNVHDEYGFPAAASHTESDRLVRRLVQKVMAAADDIVEVEEHQIGDAEIVFVAFGSVARSAAAAVEEARAAGLRVGLLRPVTIWPFPDRAVREAAARARAIVVAEMSLGQLHGEVERAVQGRCPVLSYTQVDGRLPAPDRLLETVRKAVAVC